MQTINLFITPGAVNAGINLSQYDVGREVKFLLFDDDGEYEAPSTAAVTIRATKPSGFGFVETAASVSGNAATFDIVEGMSAESGSFPAELRITDGTDILGTANFLWNVERSPHLNGTVDGDAAARSLMQDLIDSAQNANNAATAANDAADAATTAKTDAEAATTVANEAASAAETAASDANAAAAAAQAAVAQMIAIGIQESGSGPVVSFSDGANGVAMPSVVAEITPVIGRSGTPTPTNYRALTALKETTVNVAAANLLGGSDLADAIEAALGSTTRDDTARTISFASSASIIQPFMRSFKENTVYTFIYTISKASGLGANLRLVYTDGTTDTMTAVSALNTKETVVFTSDTGKTIEKFEKLQSGGTTVLYYDESGIFEGDIEAEAFQAYEGHAVPVSWETEAGAVAAGYVDVTAGKLVKTHELRTLDGTESVARDSQGRYYYIAAGSAAATAVANAAGMTGWCSHYQTVHDISSADFYATPYAMCYCNRSISTSKRVFFTDDRFSTAAEFQSWLADQNANGTPVQYVYKLATPVEYTITPALVTSLYLQNNVFSMAGDVELTYYADLKTYIDNLFAGQG